MGKQDVPFTVKVKYAVIFRDNAVSHERTLEDALCK